MNMTSTAATMTQVVSIAGMASLRVGSMTGILEKERRFVMRPAYRICGRAFVQASSGARPASVAERHDARVDALRQLARVHAEEAVRVARGGPDALMLQQVLVEQDGQVMAERRHASDREAGGGAHLVGLRLADLRHVERLGDLLDVHAV